MPRRSLRPSRPVALALAALALVLIRGLAQGLGYTVRFSSESAAEGTDAAPTPGDR